MELRYIVRRFSLLMIVTTLVKVVFEDKNDSLLLGR